MSDQHDPLLELLHERYGHRWKIRRTEHLWIATAIDHDSEHAPTLVEPDVETFARQLDDPPPRVGRSHSLLSSSFFATRLTETGDDAYWDDQPPMA